MTDVVEVRFKYPLGKSDAANGYLINLVESPQEDSALALKRFKREFCQFLLQRGGSVDSTEVGEWYYTLHRKLLLTTSGEIADLGLRIHAMRKGGGAKKMSLAVFVEQCLNDVVEVIKGNGVKRDTFRLITTTPDAASKGLDEKTLNRASIGATSAMTAHEVSLTLGAWGQLSMTWRLDDAHVAAIAAVNGEVSRVAKAMTGEDVILVFTAWGKLAHSGLKLSSVLGASEWEAMTARMGDHVELLSKCEHNRLDRALELIRVASSSSGTETRGKKKKKKTEDDDEDAPASSSCNDDALAFMFPPEPSPEGALADVGQRWISALPAGKRGDLTAALEPTDTAAESATAAEKWELVVKSAAADTSKARSAIRKAVLDADAALRFT